MQKYLGFDSLRKVNELTTSRERENESESEKERREKIKRNENEKTLKIIFKRKEIIERRRKSLDAEDI